MAKKKHRTLVLIQLAWPLEVMFLVIVTPLFVMLGTPEQAMYWSQMLGPLSVLIGAQGGAAAIGPAIKDWAEAKKATAGCAAEEM
jgi:hypothetical protein